MSDNLDSYRRKRNSASTPEPAAIDADAARRRASWCQEHHARALHWDLRLEHDGALASWAVAKGSRPDPTPTASRFAPWTAAYLDFPARSRGEYGRARAHLGPGTYQIAQGRDGRGDDHLPRASACAAVRAVPHRRQNRMILGWPESTASRCPRIATMLRARTLRLDVDLGVRDQVGRRARDRLVDGGRLRLERRARARYHAALCRAARPRRALAGHKAIVAARSSRSGRRRRPQLPEAPGACT